MSQNLPAVFNDKGFVSRFNSGRSIKTMKWAAEKQYVTQLLQRNTELTRCSSESIGISLLDAAFSGLSLAPSLGHAYLIPYGPTCTFSPGYKGLLHLVYRAGTIKSVQSVLVYKGDEFTVWTEDGERHIKHVEKHTSGAEVIAAYCIAKYANGEHNIEVMDKSQLDAVEAQATRSDRGGMVWRSAWKGQMQRKAVIRRASAYWPRDDGGRMEHALAVMQKYDPGEPEFDSTPLSEPAGEAVVLASEEQLMALHAALTDHEIEGKEASSWLQKKAESLGLTSIEAIPADMVDEAKESLINRAKTVMELRDKRLNPDKYEKIIPDMFKKEIITDEDSQHGKRS